MRYYAQLNENNICTCVKTVKDEGITENLDKNIEIPSYDESYMWKKYENGAWSTETFEPTSTAPIDEFTAVKDQVNNLQTTTGETVAMVNDTIMCLMDLIFQEHPELLG